MEQLERIRASLGDWPLDKVLKTLMLLTPTLLGLLILYLQHRRLRSRASLRQASACAQCKSPKPIAELKKCSKCRADDALYCDAKCQKAHWPTHKVVCGKGKSWKEGEAVGVEQGIPEGTTRVALENNMRLWADHNRTLLMFSTIQALSLPTRPSNSESLLLMISLIFKPPPSPSTPVHQLFDIEDATPLDSGRFASVNPGMEGAFAEIEKMRNEIRGKGGFGVAMLLVRCGAIVQVIPVGLPKVEELEAVKIDKQWKSRMTEAIKAGIKIGSSSSS